MILRNCLIPTDNYKRATSILIKKGRVKEIGKISKSLKFNQHFDLNLKKIVQSPVCFFDIPKRPSKSYIQKTSQRIREAGFACVIYGIEIENQEHLNSILPSLRASVLDFGIRSLSSHFDQKELLLSPQENPKLSSSTTAHDLLPYFEFENRWFLFEDPPPDLLIATSGRRNISNLIDLKTVIDNLSLLPASPFGMIKLRSIDDVNLLQQILLKVNNRQLARLSSLFTKNFARFFNKIRFLFGEEANFLILDEENRIRNIIVKGEFGNSNLTGNLIGRGKR
ncbi:MAG TPA: hypothetical protein EYP30_05810 [Archaeoglobaceae archaeon]|nr:hypothetical protein [Archaeoglobaceae archaeon]